MKWIALILFIAAVPFLAAAMRQSRTIAHMAWTGFGLLPFALTASPLLDIGLIAWPNWVGYAYGVNFSALDGLAIAFLIGNKCRWSELPFKAVMTLYFVTAVFSIFQADAYMASVFYVWQLLRAFLVYAAVALVLNDERAILALYRGLAIGLSLQVVVVLHQRFVQGIVQTPGTFLHQNTLGMSVHFVVLPLFALLLAGTRNWAVLVAPVAGAIVLCFTASRGSVGFAALGVFMLAASSLLRGITRRKLYILMASILVVLLMAPIAADSFTQRFGRRAGTTSEYNERAAFAEAAQNMTRKNPLGVGANNFVVQANIGGYYENAGVAARSYGAIVHNVYWLTAAELGFPGLLAFVALLVRPLGTALVAGMKDARDARCDLLVGAGTALLVVYVQNMFEWVLITDTMQYLLALTFGLIAALVRRVERAPLP